MCRSYKWALGSTSPTRDDDEDGEEENPGASRAGKTGVRGQTARMAVVTAPSWRLEEAMYHQAHF